MARVELSRRVGKWSATRSWSRWPHSSGETSQVALREAQAFEDLAGKWQAAILEAEKNAPQLRVVNDE